MQIDYYYPRSLSPPRLDRYLAAGWFRSNNLLYRSSMICLEGKLCSVINVRLALEQYEPKKRLRKLLRRNEGKFKIEIRKAFYDAEKEKLYQSFKHRFKGYIFDSLFQYMFESKEQSVFDTYEICLYDEDKLVAVSFFDKGRKSIASIMGLYDANYDQHSLGTYTMLLEVLYGQEQGIRYYYPGYILKDYNGFDYKLKLGNYQYYDRKGKWKSFDKLADEVQTGDVFKAKIKKMEEVLDQLHIPYKTHLYPLFTVGYLDFFEHFCMRSPIFIHCYPEEENKIILIVEYVLESNSFRLCKVKENKEFESFFNLPYQSEMYNNDAYYLKLLNYEGNISSHSLAYDLAVDILNLH